MTPILELQDLSFRYEGGLPGEKVLDALTFAVAPGERVGLVGCNGVGKSTLLKIMAGLEEVSNGEARLSPGYSVGILQQEPPLDDTGGGTDRGRSADGTQKSGGNTPKSRVHLPGFRQSAFYAHRAGRCSLCRRELRLSARGSRRPHPAGAGRRPHGALPIGRCTGFPAVKRSSRPSRAS